MSSYGRGRGGPRHQSSQSIPRKRPAADEEEDKWVADEERFVLRQAKRKAILRVRGGRAKPIDWLTVILRAIDKSDDNLDENEEEELDVVDPEGVFEGLSREDLADLEHDIQAYIDREINRTNKDYWITMKVLCKDRIEKAKGASRTARGVSSVASDVDKMFSTKSYPELETLEKQIRGKLDSDEDIDVDYWEHLLKTLLVWKAKAHLRDLSREIVQARLNKLRKEQETDANVVKERLTELLKDTAPANSTTGINSTSALDPDPVLKLRPEDKNREIIDEAQYLSKINQERQKISKLGYVPLSKARASQAGSSWGTQAGSNVSGANIDSSKATMLYEREMAKGVDENEEVFTGEEKVDTASTSHWSDKHRPRKPKYFNRVQMGYEWNKYNQTHYDHDNPPPKVVQGYKFNIFYPDLIDPSKAPTYRIEREGGRKRGQTFAQAGEEDTCLIRFVAGPPYEDIAFRIVDREWDYSAKRERGFKSSFEKGILQLHFQFKKIYYRK